MLNAFLLALVHAHAAGGSFAGPAGADPPLSSGTQLVVAQGEDANTLILTVEVTLDTDALAVIWPVVGLEATSVVLADLATWDRLERVTEPRVEELRCDELVEVTHWPTPPGCASYYYRPPPPKRGEDAAEGLSAAPEWSTAQLFFDVIEPAELYPFLVDRGLALTESLAEALQPHLDAGEPLLVVTPLGPIRAGTWLHPVRFRAAPGPLTLPLTLGASDAITRQELHLFTLTPQAEGNPMLQNFPRGFVQDGCVLPEGQDAATVLAGERAAVEEAAALPTWFLEYAGPADTCAPCTADPLTSLELAALGLDRLPEHARMSRIRMSWDPATLDEDPILAFDGARADTDTRFLAHEPQLAFAYPTCGTDAIPRDAAVCSNLDLPGSGCATTGGWVPGLALAATALLARRRWAVAATALLLAGTARAAPPPDPAPKTELSLALALVGTDRIVPIGLDHGAPWFGNPFLALEARRSVLAWRTGRTLGVIGGARVLVGHAAPWAAHRVVNFTLVEPVLGLDARHGRLREASPCWFGRYGVDAFGTVLDPSVSTSQAFLSGGLHGGVGAWVGRGASRTSLELRGSVILRTDGFETRFDRNVGLPGWMFFPGAAHLWLVVGRAKY